MRRPAYGNRPPDIDGATFGLGWLTGVRHIVYRSAKPSHWHSHPEYAILFCLRGEVAYEFNDRPPITLTDGSFIVFPRGLVHRHLQAIDPISVRFEMLVSPKTGKGARYGVLSDDALDRCLAPLLGKTPVLRTCPRPLLAAVRALDALAARAKGGLDAMDQARARLLGCEILLGVERRIEDSAQSGDSSGDEGPLRLTDEEQGDMMENALRWMENHLTEKLDINRLVAYIGYSRTHVFTLFRKRTGLTPADYLTRLRVRRAREMLRTTDLSAREIAAQLGFSSPVVFATVFKRTTGVTPLQWRTAAR